MVHSETQERAGVGMALFAWHQGREVGQGLADNAIRLVVMAGDAIAGHSDMLVATNEEIGGADMAGVAFGDGRDMVDGFRLCPNAGARGMTAGAIFRRVFEDAFYVALLALQRGVYIP
jgi:hypothetical protein